MNTEWSKKQQMSNEEKYQLHEFRITALEKGQDEIKNDLKEIKDVVNRLDKKLNGIPDTGLQCPIHMLKLESFDKRLIEVETASDGMKKQIITWTAVAAVVVFILSQIAIPYVLNHYKIGDIEKPRVELTTTNMALDLTGMNYKLNR